MLSSMKNLKLKEKPKVETRSAALLPSIQSFTADLYECVADRQKGNFVFSGLSVHLAASMYALGAEGNTAKEVCDALCINNDSFSDFQNLIATHLKDDEDIELSVANAIFADRVVEVKTSFMDRVKDCFLSDVTDLDFISEREEAVEVINSWCTEKTENKITGIISEDDVGSSIQMILANARIKNVTQPVLQQIVTNSPIGFPVQQLYPYE